MRSVLHKAGLSIVVASVVLLGGAASHLWGDRLLAQQDGKAPVTMDKAFPNSNNPNAAMSASVKVETPCRGRSIRLNPRLARRVSRPLRQGQGAVLPLPCAARTRIPDKVQFFIDQADSGDPQMDGVACSVPPHQAGGPHEAAQPGAIWEAYGQQDAVWPLQGFRPEPRPSVDGSWDRFTNPISA